MIGDIHPKMIETAFNIWEQIEAMAAELWDILGNEFTEIDDLRAMAREQRRIDSEDDLPF
jgi:hypothetical protein